MRHAPDTLIDRILQNDRTGFEDVAAWYSNDILRLCFMLVRNKEEAEDLMQETFFRFIQSVKHGNFRSKNGSIKGYLLRIARNLSIDLLRKRKVDFASIDDDDFIMQYQYQENFTPDRATQESFYFSAFEQALTYLTPAQRTVLVLRELNGESYKEIAEELNVSIECIKKQLFRARRKMRVLLGRFRGDL